MVSDIPTTAGYYWALFKEGSHCPEIGEYIIVNVRTFYEWHDDGNQLLDKPILMAELHGDDMVYDLDEFNYFGKVQRENI